MTMRGKVTNGVVVNATKVGRLTSAGNYQRWCRDVECISTRPMHELCLAATPPPGGSGGSGQPLRWWQQDHGAACEAVGGGDGADNDNDELKQI